MEHAIIINNIEDFKYFDKKYSKIYFGNEFCSKLLPKEKEVEEVIDIIKKKKLNITLLTPQLNSEGVKRVKKIIKQLYKEKLLSEIVVNDYGLLYYIKENFLDCEIILGRTLSCGVFLYKKSFLNKIGIKRIEIDNLKKNKKYNSSKISYYYPFSFVSVSMYCPVADIYNNKSKNHGIIDCSKECSGLSPLEIDSKFFSKKVFLKGNTQFIKNKNINSRELIKNGVDRLVFQPNI